MGGPDSDHAHTCRKPRLDAAVGILEDNAVFRKQLKRRRKFLLKEIAREKKTLLSIYGEVGHKYHEAVWMVGLMIEHMRVEVRWTKRLERELARRANALYPHFAEGLPSEIARSSKDMEYAGD